MPDPVGPDQQHWALRHQLEKQFAQCYSFAPGTGADVIGYADFAAAVQFALEHSVESLFELLLCSGGPDRLVIAGGVRMHCSMIGKLVGLQAVRDLFVPPFAYDVGTAVAAGHGETPSLSRSRTASLGLDLADDEIAAALAERGVVAARHDPAGSCGIDSGRGPRRRYRPPAGGPVGEEGLRPGRTGDRAVAGQQQGRRLMPVCCGGAR